MSKKDKGKRGEEIALKYLKKKGYKLIKKNYKIRTKEEVDLIVSNKEYIVFVEVKFRTNTNYEFLFGSVSGKKLQKILKVAKVFLVRNKEYTKLQPRFDVVLINERADKTEIYHIENAFGYINFEIK